MLSTTLALLALAPLLACAQDFSLIYPTERTLRSERGGSCLPRPDNASSAPFRTPIPLSGATPVVLRTTADKYTVYDSAIVWGENPIILSTSGGNATLANGTEYWYDNTVFDDQRAAREEGQFCITFDMSNSATANTTNVKGTPPQNPRVGSVGTLVVSYTPGSSNTSANSLVCADVVVVDDYSFPDNVTKDSCQALQPASDAVTPSNGSSGAWRVRAGGLVGAAAVVVGLAVLV
ncbi:hypothetical protein JCM3775_002100 [Rhodotorula graminis]